MSEGFNDRPRYDDRTSRGWPLPHWLNKLDVDSRRLREILRAIDAAICEIEGSAGDSSERLDGVEARLDVIAGQTTEDTEILDARVDAENQTHPNLGHNLRNIHTLLLLAENNIQNQAQEIQQLFQLHEDLKDTQIQDESDARETHRQIRNEIQREASYRKEYDGALQGQIDTLAESDIHNALSRKTELETFRAKITDEAQQRQNADNDLHEALRAEHEDRLQALGREISARTADDRFLGAEVDTLGQTQIQQALSIQNEIQQRKNTDDELREALTVETQQRTSEHQEVSRQLEQHSEEIAQNSENISDNHLSIQQETSARVADDRFLGAEVDTLGQTQIQQALSIQNEIRQRKNTDDALLTNLTAETQSRRQNDGEFQCQIDTLAEGQTKNSLSIRDEAEKRRLLLARLIQEKQDRELQIQALRKEIGELYEIPLPGLRDELDFIYQQSASNARGNLQNALSIKREAEKRRKVDSDAVERDNVIQSEAKAERLTRLNQDREIQSQVDMLAWAIIKQIIGENESRKRLISQLDEIKQKFDEIYSALVDAGAMTYRGARVATKNEIADMMNDVMSGSDDGAVRISEIPDALKEDIATRSEISEMFSDLGYTIPN